MANNAIISAKNEQVEALAEKIRGAVAGVIVDYRGITVDEDTKLRRTLREAGVSYFVVKNNILRRAAKQAGLDELCETMVGTTAFAYSNDDAVAPAKILCKYADGSDGKFSIKAGFMEGKPMDANGVKALGNLPGKQELLTMLCVALTGNLRGLAVALNAVAEQRAE